MNIQETILLAGASGVIVNINDQDGINLHGKKKAVQNIVDKLKGRKQELVDFLLNMPVEKNLHPCPLCGGSFFLHGNQDGYFCTRCQPNVRPGSLVKAGQAKKFISTE